LFDIRYFLIRLGANMALEPGASRRYIISPSAADAFV